MLCSAGESICLLVSLSMWEAFLPVRFAVLGPDRVERLQPGTERKGRTRQRFALGTATVRAGRSRPQAWGGLPAFAAVERWCLAFRHLRHLQGRHRSDATGPQRTSRGGLRHTGRNPQGGVLPGGDDSSLLRIRLRHLYRRDDGQRSEPRTLSGTLRGARRLAARSEAAAMDRGTGLEVRRSGVRRLGILARSVARPVQANSPCR